MPPRRIACLWVPDFPLAACLRNEPDLAGRPLAVLQEDGSVPRVLAATPAARKQGIGPGLSLPQARALLPSLVVKGRDPEAEGAAKEMLLDLAEAFSPVIEEGNDGIVYVELSGSGIWKNQEEERFLGEAMIRRAAADGLAASVGIAGSRLAARVAAQSSEGAAVIVPDQQEARYLSSLSIDLLHPPLKLKEKLARWGILSMGALARLDPAEIETRLGEEGLRLHRAARGIDERPLIRWRRPPGFSEGARVDWPIAEVDPLLFLARGALERLLGRLESVGLSCRGFAMTLFLEFGESDARVLKLPAPTRDPKTLLSLLRLEIESRPPREPVVGFNLVADPDLPRQLQGSLFGPMSPSPDRLASIIARLSVLVGPERIGSPIFLDGHRPERLDMAGYAPAPPPKIPPVLKRAGITLAIRLLRPRIELKVIEDFSGRPTSVRFLRGKKEVGGRIRVASGPWRLEEGWWLEDAVARDYWDVELSDGGVYRIFQDSRGGSWFADGVYD